jgi:chromosome segregation ATPase
LNRCTAAKTDGEIPMRVDIGDFDELARRAERLRKETACIGEQIELSHAKLERTHKRLHDTKQGLAQVRKALHAKRQKVQGSEKGLDQTIRTLKNAGKKQLPKSPNSPKRAARKRGA